MFFHTHACKWFRVSTQCRPVVNYNLNNKHTVDLIPLWQCHSVIRNRLLQSVMAEKLYWIALDFTGNKWPLSEWEKCHMCCN